VQINRTGNVFKGFFSANGTAWTQVGATTTIAMPSTIAVGLAVTSHADGMIASGVFDSVSITTPGPPAKPLPPTGLVATPGNAQVALSWTASAGATSYTVRRSTTSGSGYLVVPNGMTVAATSFTDPALTNGTPYFYVVSASNTGGESNNSTEASATPSLPAPGNLQATAGNTQVTLTWNAVTGAANYTVKRSTTSGSGYAVVTGGMAVTALTFTDTGLTNGTPYFYVVSANDAASQGPNSAQVQATPSGTAAISNLVVNDTATTNPPAGADLIANSTQWSVQSNFQVNATVFGDRTYTVTVVGNAALLGKPWIRTAADSKSYAPTNPPLATFTVTGTTVYLAVDKRQPIVNAKPSFLDATWADDATEMTVKQSATQSFPYHVWKKTVTSGSTVTLPTVNNAAAPCYFVIAR
jgi:cellulose 1,4-beta-cellobiosidase